MTPTRWSALSSFRTPTQGKLSTGLWKQETSNEFSAVFLRPKFDKYVSLINRRLALEEFSEQTKPIVVTETVTDCRDPKDNKFLELAVAANAACIITGDNDLLVLHPYRNIPILNAADFLAQF